MFVGLIGVAVVVEVGVVSEVVGGGVDSVVSVRSGPVVLLGEVKVIAVIVVGIVIVKLNPLVISVLLSCWRECRDCYWCRGHRW